MTFGEVWSLFQKTKGNYIKGGPCALLKVKMTSDSLFKDGPCDGLYNNNFSLLGIIAWANVRCGCQDAGEYNGYPGIDLKVIACRGTGPGMPDKKKEYLPLIVVILSKKDTNTRLVQKCL